MTPSSLRKKHPRFVYESFDYAPERSGLRISFTFVLEPDIVFTPSILIRGAGEKEIETLTADELGTLAFHLGLAEIPSYWKCAVSPVIDIRAGKLSPKQTAFFKKLLMQGLGEFFYVNGVAPGKDFVKIISEGPLRTPVEKRGMPRRTLFPIGGGKDSLAAIAVMHAAREAFRPMILGDVPAARRLVKAAKLAQPIVVDRTIDPALIALNKKGYLNGHTPFSAYLAFLGIAAAGLFGYDSVAVANERSANEPTAIVRGRKINHQYSKTFEFEKDFRAYAARHLAKNVSYYSILRPLYELQIAEIAAWNTKALRVSVSCNAGQKSGTWCGACAKCITVFILLYPFVAAKTLTGMFRKDLFEDGKLWHFIPELTGADGIKPFDCVATKKEMRAALILALGKAKRKGYVPKLLRRFSRELLPKMRMGEKDIAGILGAWDKSNFVPKRIAGTIKELTNT